MVWSGAGRRQGAGGWRLEAAAPSVSVDMHGHPVGVGPGAGLSHFNMSGAQALEPSQCREAASSQAEDKFNP